MIQAMYREYPFPIQTQQNLAAVAAVIERGG
jgi:hypothetical protein